jgi:hypothetical protein
VIGNVFDSVCLGECRIVGIVIDAFGALKQGKEKNEEDLMSICFVCNIARFKVDQSGIGKELVQSTTMSFYLVFTAALLSKNSKNKVSAENHG